MVEIREEFVTVMVSPVHEADALTLVRQIPHPDAIPDYKQIINFFDAALAGMEPVCQGCIDTTCILSLK